MQSDCNIKQLSRGQGPSVHRYYDVAIEEPDGDRIAYFEFDDEQIPGPGNLIVADGDGGNAREVARCDEGIGHVGGNGTWIGKGRLAFSPHQQSEAGAVVRDIDGDTGDIHLPADVRSFHEQSKLAILLGDSGYAQADRYAGRQMLRTWHAETGDMRELLRADQADALHPRKAEFEVEKTNFQNPKWSPDGKQFFVVFGTEVYRNSSGRRDYPSIKSLILGDADGRNIQFVGEFGHHPMWHPDGNGILAHTRRADGGQDLLLYPLDGNNPEVFMADLPGVHCTPDRGVQRLVTDVFDQEKQRALVLLVSIPDGEQTILAEGRHKRFDHVTGSHPHPQWSRDESRIFFNMADSGVPQVYAATL